jgi:hypothetical protein
LGPVSELAAAFFDLFDFILLRSRSTVFMTLTQHSAASSTIPPMEKLQKRVQSMVDSKLLKPTDGIWKIAFLYGNEWGFWKKELESFEFGMSDPVSDLLAVEVWEENEG